MNDNLDIEEQNKIPTFLKVLCILTFIGAGMGFLSALSGIFTIKSSIASLENSSKIFDSSPLGNMSNQIEAMKKWGMISNILNLIGNAFCLTGALMMWKLKKIGFFTYILGHVFAIIGGFLISGNPQYSNSLMSSLMMFGFIIQIILSITFIIMYGANYKYLKN